MEMKKEAEFLENSPEFIKWKGKNKENYLSYMLFISGEEEDRLEVGYYNRKKDKVTTFCILGCGKKEKNIEIKPEESVFRKPEIDVEKLDINDVNVEAGETLAIAEKLQKSKYPSETPIKIIMILQKLEPYGQIYNLTYVTKCFKTLNLKIDSGTGEVVDEQLVSLMQFPGK